VQSAPNLTEWGAIYRCSTGIDGWGAGVDPSILVWTSFREFSDGQRFSHSKTRPTAESRCILCQEFSAHPRCRRVVESMAFIGRWTCRSGFQKNRSSSFCGKRIVAVKNLCHKHILSEATYCLEDIDLIRISFLGRVLSNYK
jgi:hypothetical protein